MIEFVICNQADLEIFNKQDAALKEHIPGLVLESKLEDVDGSIIYFYKYDGGKIKLHLDCYTNGVMLSARADISRYFENAS